MPLESPYDDPVVATTYGRLAVPAQFVEPARALVAAIDPRRGGRVLDVGTGTGVVAAVLADAGGPHILRAVALAFALAGLALYAAVLARFDPRELAHGRGAHWIAGGALAIGALAVADLVRAQDAPLGAHGVVRAAVIALWVAAMAWLVPLVAAELRWPRLAPDPRRWATVFPLGMYAAMSFAVSGVTGWAAPRAFARVETWVAAAAWAALAFAGAAHAMRGRTTSPR
jgi:tellurite resistance protein TehA-like permease